MKHQSNWSIGAGRAVLLHEQKYTRNKNILTKMKEIQGRYMYRKSMETRL